MKKLLPIVAASLAVAAFAEPQQVGVTAITTTLKNTVVAVPYTSLAGGSISAKELVKTANLAEGTVLYVYKNGTYTGWLLANNEWVPADSVSTVDGISVGVPAANETLAAGNDAIWIVRPSTDTGSKTFYIYGTPTTITTKTISAGANLVANPLRGPAVISFANETAPVAGDEITIPGDGLPVRYTYRTKKDGSAGAWRCNGATAELPQIAAGQGFWYVRTTGAANATLSFSAPVAP